MILNSFEEALREIQLKINGNSPLIIGIDGRSASGKSTFAEFISEHISCRILHMDDFFLMPHQRTAERLSVPGGNSDIERFNTEISNGILSRKDFFFSPFDCKTMTLLPAVKVEKSDIYVVEGSYSLHPSIKLEYDLSFFITTDKITQKNRINIRNGNNSQMFFSKWIPLEENYFSVFNIPEKSDFIIST